MCCRDSSPSLGCGCVAAGCRPCPLDRSSPISNHGKVWLQHWASRRIGRKRLALHWRYWSPENGRYLGVSYKKRVALKSSSGPVVQGTVPRAPVSLLLCGKPSTRPLLRMPYLMRPIDSHRGDHRPVLQAVLKIVQTRGWCRDVGRGNKQSSTALSQRRYITCLLLTVAATLPTSCMFSSFDQVGWLALMAWPCLALAHAMQCVSPNMNYRPLPPLPYPIMIPSQNSAEPCHHFLLANNLP